MKDQIQAEDWRAVSYRLESTTVSGRRGRLAEYLRYIHSFTTMSRIAAPCRVGPEREVRPFLRHGQFDLGPMWSQ